VKGAPFPQQAGTPNSSIRVGWLFKQGRSASPRQNGTCGRCCRRRSWPVRMRSKTSRRVGSESATSAISVSVRITRNRVVAPRFKSAQAARARGGRRLRRGSARTFSRDTANLRAEASRGRERDPECMSLAAASATAWGNGRPGRPNARRAVATFERLRRGQIPNAITTLWAATQPRELPRTTRGRPPRGWQHGSPRH
jgi:hypothetical protein